MGKKNIIVVAGLLAVVALSLSVFLVFKIMLDPDALKPEIQKHVKRLTGLELELQGDISLKFFPWFGIELGPASLGSPEGFSGQLVSVTRLSVETKLLPLLQGRIDANSLEIDGLDVNLVRNKQGRWNFQLLPVKDVSVHEDQVIVDTTKGDRYSFSYLIQGLNIRNASLTVSDAQSKQQYAIRNGAVSAEDVTSGKTFFSEISFDASSSQPRLSGSVQLRGSVAVFPEALRFVLRDVALNANVRAQGLPFATAGLALSLDSDIQAEQGLFELTRFVADAVCNGGMFRKEAHAYLEGTGSLDLEQAVAKAQLVHLNGLGLESAVTARAVNLLQDPQLTAQVRTNTFNPKELLASCTLLPDWMGRMSGLTRCAYDGNISLDRHTLKLDAAALHLDGANFQVKALLGLPGVRTFDLAIAGTRFDICSVFPHDGSGESPQGKQAVSAGPSRASAGAPLSLHQYNGKLRLNFNNVVCGKRQVGRLGMDASLAKGRLEVSNLQLAVGQSSLSADVRARFPQTGYEPDAGKARIHLRSANLRKVLARLGHSLAPTQDPEVLGKVRLDLEAAFSPEGYVLHAPRFELDGNTFILSAEASKPFPSRIKVDIKGGVLDLNRYRPVPPKKAKEAGQRPAAAPVRKKPSKLPAFVRKAALSAHLVFEKLHYDLFAASNLLADLVSDKGDIRVSRLECGLFGGYVRSSGKVGLHQTPAPLSVKLSGRGVNVHSLLAALGVRPHVTGRADLTADVTSRGFAAKEFLAGLNGKASALIVGGAILGLNLSSSALTSQQGIVGPKAKTPFREARVDLAATNGTVHFSRFNVSYPPNTVNGTGDISLPKNTISASLSADLQGLPTLPITISGSLDKPDVGLNGAALVGNVVGGVVKEILRSPLTIEQGIQNGIESLFSDKNKKKKKE